MSALEHKKQTPVSYYEILNISPQARDEEIKQAYRKLARRFHPDLNGNNKELAARHFHQVHEAYTQLMRKRGTEAANNNNKLGFWAFCFSALFGKS